MSNVPYITKQRATDNQFSGAQKSSTAINESGMRYGMEPPRFEQEVVFFKKKINQFFIVKHGFNCLCNSMS